MRRGRKLLVATALTTGSLLSIGCSSDTTSSEVISNPKGSWYDDAGYPDTSTPDGIDTDDPDTDDGGESADSPDG